MTGKGRDYSGSVTFAGGDSGTAKDTVVIRDEETFKINDLTITYNGGGTTAADVELYDEPDGTSEADVSNQLGVYHIAAGGDVTLSGISRKDVEDDVVAVVRNNDADVSIVVGGEIVTG